MSQPPGGNETSPVSVEDSAALPVSFVNHRRDEPLFVGSADDPHPKAPAFLRGVHLDDVPSEHLFREFGRILAGWTWVPLARPVPVSRPLIDTGLLKVPTTSVA